MDPTSWGGVAQNRNLLFFGTMDRGRFLAVDKKTGTIQWEFKGQSSAFATPAVENDTVVYGDNMGNLYTLDAGSGRLINRTNIGGGGIESIAVQNEVAVVGTKRGLLTAVDIGHL